MSLAVDTTDVAAFEALGQRVTGSLALTNRSAAAVDLALDSALSQPDWSVDFDEPRLVLQAGESAEIPVTVRVPADARADLPVRLTVRASDGARAATTDVELTPRVNGELVAPVRDWTLPPELLGGLDAAAAGLGAAPVVSIDPVAEAALHDGVVALGGGMDVSATLPLTLTVDLAGDEPVPVTGTILDPSAADGSAAGTVRTFELQLSIDGVTYETALSGEMSGALAEQGFVLPEPVQARFARLVIASVEPGSVYTRLGEWKVVASPEWRPSSEPVDIADPGLGGHVAWVDPQPGDFGSLDRMLDAADASGGWLSFDPEQTSSVSWALGFQDGRAARVIELGWSDPIPSEPALRLRRLDLVASIDGPLGPWAPLGTWELERDASGAVAPFRLEAPTWARYIRMTGRIPEPERYAVELPHAIGVLEEEPSDTYRSIAGEWGYGSSAGPYEWAESGVPEPADEPAREAEQAADQQVDVALIPGDPAGGRVSRGQDIDWYTLTIPEDQITARFSVSGRPSVGVGLALFDESGAEVPMGRQPGSRPGTVDHVASVTPGSSYRLRVEQPPSSVVVAYDTSMSIAHYVPIMAGALRSYSRGVVPGEEAVQLIDYDAQPLLEDFSDDAWELQSSLDAHAGSQTGSSSAEVGLIDAAKLLATREGARAILLLTDAETSSYFRNTEAWGWLASVSPQIFAVHVGGAFSPVLDQRMMQDWAAAGGGPYQYARSTGDVDEAFERMAAWLRRPADYGLVMELSSEPVAPPKPGTLRVVSADHGAGEGAADTAAEADTAAASSAAGTPEVAVELVLDTSGSMLKRLGRERRIDIAKTVLRDLVNGQLRAGTPVALRTFRPVALSCETELAVPLGPLDPAAMTATIDGLTIPKSVRTPLAAAIAAVGDDLAEVDGPRVVVVVSDGRESCGGDPEAAVQSLIDQGFDVSVNVVGLGLDRKSRKTIARLADIGNGHYYDARDAADMRDAVRAAFGAPYEVVDASGTVVANGTVDGAALELPPGPYRVRLVGSTPLTLDVVIIEPDRAKTLVAPP
jgi:Mg-chelatase subunit ChlD